MTAPRRLRAGDGVVVRTPLLPMTELVAWAACGDGGAMRDQLAALLARPEVDEAIFVASPALHAAIPRWRAAPGAAHVQGIEHALVKYVARMAGRATPFGLFSAISVGELVRCSSIIFGHDVLERSLVAHIRQVFLPKLYCKTSE